MKRISDFILIAVAAVMLLSSCSPRETESSVIKIDPDEQALNFEQTNTVLYYANETYSMLVGIEAKIDVPVSSSTEYAVLEALIGGAGNTGDTIRSIINPQTKILSVSRYRTSVTVVLSKEFLDWSFIPDTNLDSGNADLIKQLSVYAVVNSLVESALCQNVQILVDKNGNGSGQRLRENEVGFAGEGVLGPLTRQEGYILTSEKTLEQIFMCLSNRDYIGLYDYVANVGAYGEEKPVMNTFVTNMQSMGLTIENFSIEERTDLSSQSNKIIICSYMISGSSDEKTEYRHVPVRLTRENGLWKISYEMLEQIFD